MFRTRLVFLTLPLLTAVSWVDATGAESQKVTVLIQGAHCEKDVKAIRAGLAKVKHVKFDKDAIEKGDKPRYFTEPFVVELVDTTKSDIGALAETLSNSKKTPHAKKFPTKVNLVFYSSESRIDEASVMALRESLRQVNGLEVDVPGGLGGFPSKGFYWVQLEDAGGAELKQTLEAAKKSGLKLSTVKKKSQ